MPFPFTLFLTGQRIGPSSAHAGTLSPTFAAASNNQVWLPKREIPTEIKIRETAIPSQPRRVQTERMARKAPGP